MASIDQLDNPLLLFIFNNLSIQELFPVGRVCVRWNELRVTSARAQQELVLLIGKDAQTYIEESGLTIPQRESLVDENGDDLFPKNDQSHAQLQIHSFPLDFARLLYTHFDNLTTLTISTRSYTKDIDSFIHFLEQFKRPNSTLHTLKLYSSNDDQDTELNTDHLYSYYRLSYVANSIRSLRKLTFDVNTKFGRNSKFIRLNLPMLAKLEVFEFNSADELDCFQHSIMKYAVGNRRLRSIGLQFPIHDFAWLLSLSTELSSRFTHLHLLLNSTNSPSFVNLFRQFSDLTSLEITYKLDTFTIFTLFRPLTNLPNLLSLTVNIDGTVLRPVARNARGRMHFELPSVKVFTINIASRASSHHFMHNCNMIRVFPNVQVVRVSQEEANCFKCDMNMDGFTTTDPRALEEHCARYRFCHFTHSQHLKIVSYKISDKDNVSSGCPQCRQWAWNQMEPYEEERIALSRMCRLTAEDEEQLDPKKETEIFNHLVDSEEDHLRGIGEWWW